MACLACYTQRTGCLTGVPRGVLRIVQAGHRGGREGVERVAYLVHCEAGVDAGAVDLLALHVEAAHRGPHALGAHGHDADVGAEGQALRLEVPQEEPVGQPQHRARLHGAQNRLVVVRLRTPGTKTNQLSLPTTNETKKGRGVLPFLVSVLCSAAETGQQVGAQAGP